MAFTLGMTGMARDTEQQLRSLFDRVYPQLSGQWSLSPHETADYVIVDMDTLYGPASWMQLHSAGKQVIALTDSARTQADFLLDRQQLDAGGLVELLKRIDGSGGGTTVAAPEAAAMDITLDSAVSLPFDDITPSLRAVPGPSQPLPTPPVTPSVSAPAIVTAPPPAVPAASIAPATQRADKPLHAWLQPGMLSGKRVLRGRDGSSVLIDADNGSWLGPSSLKTLGEAFGGDYLLGDFKDADADALHQHATAHGQYQPIARLRWGVALAAGKGELLPGYDRQGRYLLNKWPQTEREFPRHFRIATAMMKGPATLAQIAEAANVPLAEVADFVNANLLTGYAEPAVETTEPTPEAPKPGGLLGRLRR